MGMTPLHRSARRRRARLAAQGALIAACCGLAAACGSTAAPSSSSPGHSAGSGNSATSTAKSKVVLDITLAGASGPTQHWTLHCDPPSGNTPDAALSCNKILSSTVFKAPARHVMCPMMIANARTYTITGIMYGKHVHQTIVDGGCDLGRYATMANIFN